MHATLIRENVLTKKLYCYRFNHPAPKRLQNNAAKITFSWKQPFSYHSKLILFCGLIKPKRVDTRDGIWTVKVIRPDLHKLLNRWSSFIRPSLNVTDKGRYSDLTS